MVSEKCCFVAYRNYSKMHFYLKVFVRKAVNAVDFEVVLTWRGKVIIFNGKI